jgi:Fe-S cluster biogenesis protein NfuA
MATQSQAPEELVERVQDLLGSLDEIADPVAQARVQELVGAVLELYGAGLERILGVIADAGEGAIHIRKALLDDGIVASLLLIHGLYPVPLEERVTEAIESVRPFLASHGGGVEILSIEDGVARLRLQGSCNGCPASASTLEHALKEAIEEAAPDLLSLEVEGAVGLESKDSKSSDLGFALPMVQAGPAALPMADAPYTECPSGVGK